MRKVEALLKILLDLVDYIFNFVPIIGLCLGAFALLALTDESIVSRTFMFFIVEGYQADLLESIYTSSCSISAWLLICW